MSRSFVASLSAMLLLPAAAMAGDLRADANALFAPITSAAAAKAVKSNEITPAKIELGKKLFFDPRMSSSQIISCNSCHNLSLGGVDAGSTSIGHGWQKGPRRAPTVLNAVFNVAQFWDGRAPDLKTQAKGPVQAGVEMNNTPANVEATLNSIPAYVAEFKKAFPSDAKPANFDNFALAIEAFEATLITPGSRFDKFLAGDEAALDATEKQGLRLFMDKGCVSCHGGVNVGGAGYFPFGVAQKPSADVLPAADKGRAAVTKSASDDYVFRASPLRNVALRAPYFHTGSVWTLEEAVSIMAADQLGVKLAGDETKAIVAFLGSLTGEQPRVDYPVLPGRTNDTPRPAQTTTTATAGGH
ncbi:cytochrome-c peroxidase [Methylosinus sp. Sm6]|uniref:cytochrome-c peroxidase n=1 Tax=Methylosinus sp. Sm6 TaxID=2866948 RepID=UPI001C995BA2|nr:cytochrome-c peroxidase [Methylosinus sp. Sm6]MBY6243455.1 cytochrome-c peroxidase [Methylosinus sp. Sm6]